MDPRERLLEPEALRRTVEAALAEDLGEAGDITSDAVVPDDLGATAAIVARARLVLAGLPVAAAVYRALDPALEFEPVATDGETVPADAAVARVRGNARAILRGERTVLNFLMRLSGIAGATRAAVREIEGTGAAILDTRKTAPGLRNLDKYAVACGGGRNHRLGLFDEVMIKDTHVAVAGSIGEAVRAALARGHDPGKITAEVRDTVQLTQAIEAGAGRALLDNMELATMRECVALAAGRIELEASGGLRPGGLRAVAGTGVDCLSLGWLTHSAPAADLAMEMESRS